MILVGMGANLPTAHGDPLATLHAAVEAMPSFGVDVVRRSSFYRTPAMAAYAQPPYVNAVIVVESALPAEELLQTLHRIEAQFGRVRLVRWGERTLDLDLLDYNGVVIPSHHPKGLQAGTGPIPLCLPHPGICERGFVLVPLAEVAPEWRHPVNGEGAAALLRRLIAEQGEAAMAGIERLTSG